ncbi:MAG: dihydroorotate dehydrogenase [Candidatus Omnitrophota bacterium]
MKNALSKKSDDGGFSMETRIGEMVFRNPVTVASGTFGTKGEYADFVDYAKLGAIITKTITVRPRPGNPMPRICEVPGGMLNAIGLQNAGLEDFITQKIPVFAAIATPLIVNIAGEELEEFSALASRLDREKKTVKALEVNLSCPNVEAGGVRSMKKREKILAIIRAVRQATGLPFFAKISPELGDVLEVGEAVLAAGANGLSVMNTLKGLAIDTRSRRPRLANVTGGLSGPAIKPVALRYVYEVKRELKAPVIASGGISTAQDAIEFLIAGADLIAVGSANFIEPSATMEILAGIEKYCREQGIRDLAELRGSLLTGKTTS